MIRVVRLSQEPVDSMSPVEPGNDVMEGRIKRLQRTVNLAVDKLGVGSRVAVDGVIRAPLVQTLTYLIGHGAVGTLGAPKTTADVGMHVTDYTYLASVIGGVPVASDSSSVLDGDYMGRDFELNPRKSSPISVVAWLVLLGVGVAAIVTMQE